METAIAILPTSYLPPIAYFQKLIYYPNCVVEYYEHFIKQTIRSRCTIYSPNGASTLSIPVINRNHRQIIKDIKISYDYNWQKIHWRTLEAGYRRSPFFEYYEDDFHPFYYSKKFDYLIDLNEALLQVIMGLLKIKANYSLTDSYKQNYDNADDYRKSLALKKEDDMVQKTYSQVFETKHGFIDNLSIVDLIFNQGSRALEFT